MAEMTPATPANPATETTETTEVIDGGPWQGPTAEEWIERIAGPSVNNGETLPFIQRRPPPARWTGTAEQWRDFQGWWETGRQ